jgi:hypothetical protein
MYSLSSMEGAYTQCEGDSGQRQIGMTERDKGDTVPVEGWEPHVPRTFAGSGQSHVHKVASSGEGHGFYSFRSIDHAYDACGFDWGCSTFAGAS